jgi:hypothetical protein
MSGKTKQSQNIADLRGATAARAPPTTFTVIASSTTEKITAITQAASSSGTATAGLSARERLQR